MQTKIKKIGNSMGFIIPKALLKKLYLKTGDKVEIHEVNGQIIVNRAKPKYTLAELLAKCDDEAPLSEEMKMWDQMKPVGFEYGSTEWDEADPINNEVIE